MGGTAAVFISVLDVIPKSLAIKLAELKIGVYRIWLHSFVFGTAGPEGLFLNCAPFCSVTGRVIGTSQGNIPGIVPRSTGTSAQMLDPGLVPNLSCRAHSEQPQSDLCHSLALGTQTAASEVDFSQINSGNW